MMRFLNILILSLAILMNSAWADDLSNLPPDVARIKQSGVLRVAVYQMESPAIAMQNSIGQWSGIEIDLVKEVANQLGVKLVVIAAPSYSAMIDMVVRRQVDLGSELAMVPDRALRVAFTHPYYSYHPHLMVNRLLAAKNGWTNPTQILQGISTQKPTLAIGVLAGSASGEIMHTTFPEAPIVSYSNIVDAYNDVMQGKIFAAMGTSPIEVQGFLQSNPRASLLAQDIQVSQAKVLIAVALPWQDFHMRELMNSYFNYLQKNGVFEQVFQKYGESST